MKPKLDAMEADIAAHGEVHAVVEGYDQEVEMRRGTTRFVESANIVEVRGPDHRLYIDADRVVSWYKPLSLFH